MDLCAAEMMQLEFALDGLEVSSLIWVKRGLNGFPPHSINVTVSG